jgi:adenylate cyclase
VKKHLLRIAVGLVILLVTLVHGARWYEVDFVNRLDAIIYDARLRVTMPNDKEDRVVILDIDEKSLAEVGRWPWGRDTLAAVITKLFDKYKVAIVGFDVVFAEPDDSSGIKVLEKLSANELSNNAEFQDVFQKLKPTLDRDAIFAASLRNRAVVLGYYFSNDANARQSGVIPPAVLPAGTFLGRHIPFTQWRGFGANLATLQEAALGAGHFNPLPDAFDGITRRVPMLVEFDNQYYESLSLAMVRKLLNDPPIAPGYPADRLFGGSYKGLEWLELKVGDDKTLRIPVDKQVAALVPYRGPERSFPYISLSDVLNERVDPAALEGRIALVGTTAPGLLDLHATPVAPVYPGVEIHANLIASMLWGGMKQKPPYELGAEVTALIVTGLILAFLFPFLSPVQSMLAAALALGIAVTINFSAWHLADLVIPMASGVILIFALFAFNSFYGYFVESRSKRQFTELFGQYVPPELVDEMAKNPANYSMDGKAAELTVLFSDVRGFTTISESLEPRKLTQLMNDYLTEMTRVIRNENQGTLDKYIGDAIMAFWGAPVEQPDHARRGVLAAMAMQSTLAGMHEHFQKTYNKEIKIGVGLSTGQMIVGDMGSELRKAYTVMGDAVNLGSRLEGVTKDYGVGILVSEGTRKACPDIVFREIDLVRVKGKDRPVAIYEPLGLDVNVPKAKIDEIKLFNQFLKLYRTQDWDQAEVQLLNLQRMDPNSYLYRSYADRVAHYRANPPGPNWDGVWVFTHK